MANALEAVQETEPRILYSACPLCDGKNIPYVGRINCTKHPVYNAILPPTMAWRRCGGCRHVFTEGYFTDAALDILFSRTHDNQRVGYDFEKQRHVSARIVARVARHVADGCWLDIGVGNGSLLFTAEEWGYRPIGTDLRNENVHALRELGFEAHSKPVEYLKTSERCSVISMADVLEHIPFPRVALNAVNRLLRTDGVFFVSMPNSGSMAWRLLDHAKKNPYWGEIEHYHNFSRAELYRILDQHGFEAVEYHVSERYRVCMEVIAMKRSDRFVSFSGKSADSAIM